MRLLVVGGASSGKSAFAENAVLRLSPSRVYLATMQPFGREGALRVERHRRLREGKGFSAVERCRDLASLEFASCACLQACSKSGGAFQAAALVEDLGNLLANEMFSDDGTFDGDGALARADAGMRHVERSFEHVVAVANDVGRDVALQSVEMQAYVAQLGALNCMLATRFDAVVEVECGVPHKVKGDAEWCWL